MALGKKGVFFTLIMILFISVLLMSYRIVVDYSETDKMHAVGARIDMINDFMKSMEKDAERALYISSFRAMVSLNNYVVSEGEKITLPEMFTEIMENGTIEHNTSLSPLMSNQTIDIWIPRMITLADELGINLTINYSEFSVSHADAWTLRVNMDISYFINDTKGTAQWTRNKNVTAYISIIGWQDPLYGLKTGSTRTIYKTNITSWDSAGLLLHMQNKTYRSSQFAPSFLDRLQNLTIPKGSGYGIETIINPNVFGNEENISCVDYYYFNSSGIVGVNVTDITDNGYPDFRLDTDHCIYYNVSCE
jgi:hypothetical protein